MLVLFIVSMAGESMADKNIKVRRTMILRSETQLCWYYTIILLWNYIKTLVFQKARRQKKINQDRVETERQIVLTKQEEGMKYVVN